MKKLFVFVLLAVLLISACQPAAAPTEEAAPPAAEEEAAPPEEEAPPAEEEAPPPEEAAAPAEEEPAPAEEEAAPAEEEPEEAMAEKRALRVTFSWPTFIDPAIGNDFSSSTSLANIYDTLVFPNPDGTMAPWLAESWESSDDGLDIHIHSAPGSQVP